MVRVALQASLLLAVAACRDDSQPCEFGAVCGEQGLCYRGGTSQQRWEAKQTMCLTTPLPARLVVDLPIAVGTQVRCAQGNRHVDGSHSNFLTMHALDLYQPDKPAVVVAALEGEVLATVTKCPGVGLEYNNDQCGRGFGNQVQVVHADGSIALYAHLGRVEVSPGQRILSGQPLGIEGATGAASSRHLHFSVNRPSPLDTTGLGFSVPFEIRLQRSTRDVPETISSSAFPCAKPAEGTPTLLQRAVSL